MLIIISQLDKPFRNHINYDPSLVPRQHDAAIIAVNSIIVACRSGNKNGALVLSVPQHWDTDVTMCNNVMSIVMFSWLTLQLLQ